MSSDLGRRRRMISRRDLVVAGIVVACTVGAFAAADELPLIGSSVFDWNSVRATPTETGAVRSFFKVRTPTLEQLEVHVTTLNPGKAPHPPHRHPNEEMLIIREGTLEALINGEWKRVGPGSVIFFAS